MESCFSCVTQALSGSNLIHDVGYLESGLGCSPELIVLTDEIISMSRKFIEGIRLDDEALALEVIHDVGPGGGFLGHDHTLGNWRDAWFPTIFDRQRFSRWESQGSPEVNVRLKEKSLALMQGHLVDSLPPDVEQEIERILTHHPTKESLD